MDATSLPPEQQQLFKLLVDINNKQTQEIKLDFQQATTKIESVSKEVLKLNQKQLNLERQSRKNNIIIFGLQGFTRSEDWLKDTLKGLNLVLETNIHISDINNYYSVGKSQNPPIVLEFISFLKKTEIFKNKDNLKKLKTKGWSVTNDLCPEDRLKQKKLREHLKIARSQNCEAKIAGYKLIINNQEYSVEDLAEIENKKSQEIYTDDSDIESEVANPTAEKENPKNHTEELNSSNKTQNKTVFEAPVEQQTSDPKRKRRKIIYEYSPKTRNSKK